METLEITIMRPLYNEIESKGVLIGYLINFFFLFFFNLSFKIQPTSAVNGLREGKIYIFCKVMKWATVPEDARARKRSAGIASVP